jgi:hypothetical protein
VKLRSKRQEESHARYPESIQVAVRRSEDRLHEGGDAIHGGSFSERSAEDDGRDDALLHEHDEVKRHGYAGHDDQDDGDDGRHGRRQIAVILILKVLSKGPNHGYGILKELESLTGGCCVPTFGTIYPNLKELTRNGYAKVNEHIEQDIRESKCESCGDLTNNNTSVDCREWHYRGKVYSAAPLPLLIESILGGMLSIDTPPVVPLPLEQVPENLMRYFNDKKPTAGCC